jgi:peroxiredoxin (alkyl hydroperoxide reductase subunit C)
LANILGIVDQEFEYDEEGNEVFTGSNVTYRATYLIDEEGKIFHESVNDMPLGRNVDEYLRLIDAYTHVQKYGEVCPANWQEGKDAMHADRAGVAEYLTRTNLLFSNKNHTAELFISSAFLLFLIKIYI